jgi:hypothetical protein
MKHEQRLAGQLVGVFMGSLIIFAYPYIMKLYIEFHSIRPNWLHYFLLGVVLTSMINIFFQRPWLKNILILLFFLGFLANLFYL